MSKIGVRLSIDVKSIEKARLVEHSNGKVYLNMTAFIDPHNEGKYGDHGMITQDVSKEEKDNGVKGAILGNCKVFWQEPAQQQTSQYQQQAPQQYQQQAPQQQAPDNFDDQDIPF